MHKTFHWNKWGLLPATLLTLATNGVLFWMSGYPSWPIRFALNGHPLFPGNASDFYPLVIIQIIILGFCARFNKRLEREGNRRANIAGALAAFACGDFFFVLMALVLTRKTETSHLPFYFFWLGLGFGLLMAALAYGLEQLRRYPPKKEMSIETITDEVIQRHRAYSERVTIEWLNYTLLVGSMPLMLCLWQIPEPIIKSIGGVLFLVLFIGEFGLSLTSKRLMLHLGFLHIPILRIPIGKIVRVDVLNSGQMQDFGCWGLRYSPKYGWGFIWSDKGIQIHTTRGRRITVSSVHSEELATLLKRLI